MTASNYGACLTQMLKYEGGYSNHPSDPGGVTLEGVIQTRYNEYRRSKGRPQKALTPSMRGTPEWIAERNEIYRIHYWNAVRGDQLPAGVDLAVFDYGVNSGPSRALAHAKPYEKYAPIARIKAICARRLAFVRALRTWAVFGKGWGSRIVNVEAVGVKMALSQTNAPPDVQKKLEKEADKAGKTANKQTGGIVVGTPTGGAALYDLDLWLQIGVGAAIGGAIVWLGYRAYINYQRKKAYTDAAKAA